MIRIDTLTIPVREALTREKIAAYLKIEPDMVRDFTIIRRSIDARRGRSVSYVYMLDVQVSKEKEYLHRRHLPQGVRKAPTPVQMHIPNLTQHAKDRPRPIVVGFGPAGMFCALVLARAGLKPIVLERGEPVEERTKKVQTFWRTGVLDPDSNVQFGEGGAGTFSDGKLNTLIKDKEQIGRFILTEMAKAGAPEEILYEAKPHIGTDRLQQMVRHIREEIISLGGEVRFHTTLTGLQMEEGRLTGVTIMTRGETSAIETDTLFLCIGHSARDTFTMLEKSGIPMQAKAFAMGVRVEHLQSWINEARYHADAKYLGAADYKVTYTTESGRGVYSFCMCPGGEVVASASEPGRLVVNGMSNFARDGRNANSALIVTVTPEDYEGYQEKPDDVLAGMRLQRNLEEKAFIIGGRNYRAPVQRVEDFHHRKDTVAFGEVEPTYTAGVTASNLWDLLPEYMSASLDEALRAFDRNIHGFDHPDALLTGIESRTSSPVRILRDTETGQSTLGGLYPVGEGAGYAGGIMSAAIDGVKQARKYLDTWQR